MNDADVLVDKSDIYVNEILVRIRHKIPDTTRKLWKEVMNPSILTQALEGWL